MTEDLAVRQFCAGVLQVGKVGARWDVTEEEEGCLWDLWPVPPAGSSPVGPANAWWWCRPSRLGQKWCLWADRGGTAAELLWLYIRTKDEVRNVDTITNSLFLPQHYLTLTKLQWLKKKKVINQPGVVRQAQITADYVLQQTSWWLFGELQDHFALKERTVSQKEVLGVMHTLNGSFTRSP